jgi:phytoene dehydrogenase-like protein
LPAGTIRLNTPITAIEANQLITADGPYPTQTLVLAADPTTTAKLLNLPGPAQVWNSTTTVYYGAKKPLGKPIITLNADEVGPVNNLLEISAAAPGYAPPGHSLFAISVVGLPPEDDATLDGQIRQQLTDWYGEVVKDWQTLKTYRIPQALPQLLPRRVPRNPLVNPKLFLCGDYLETPSINGALESGRKAAEAILAVH